MQKSETAFWSVVLIAAMYIAADYSLGLSAKAVAQSQADANQPIAAQGMGCMAKGSGCGCAGMRKQ